jgi:hypothetical protein
VRRAAFVVTGLVLAAGLAALRAAPWQQQPQPPIRVGTSLVRLDVYPTRDGHVVQGLKASDFEVFEDGVPQTVETFEHVAPVRGPQTARSEPASQREMANAVANPRNRVFLIFLDGPFVDFDSSRTVNEPLIRFLKDYVADDDLVGVMLPGTSAKNVTFGRKTTVLESSLRQAFTWGRQDKELDPELDRRQIQYTLCYPGHNDVP